MSSASTQEQQPKTSGGEWIDRYLRACGIPERFDAISLEDTLLAGHEEGLWAMLAAGTGLLLTGPVGAGKTTVAAAIAREAVARSWRVRFTSAVSMFDEMRSCYDNGDERYTTEMFTMPRLLVIDDLGKGRPTQWVARKVFEVLDTRYNAMLPTVITTQYDEDGIADRLTADGDEDTAQAIMSRIYGMTKRVAISGKDRRKP